MEIVKTVIVLVAIFQLASSYQISLTLDSTVLKDGEVINGEIAFEQDNLKQEIYCEVSIDPKTAPAMTSVSFLELSFSEIKEFFITPTTSPLQTGISFKVVLTCNNEKETDKRENVVVVETQDPDTSVDGDPHFTQLIVDSKTKKEERICYDVTGKSGEKIQIFAHQPSNTYVYGQLLDDYYMHVIEIFSTRGNITVTTKEFLVNNEVLFKWKKWNGLAVYHKSGFLVNVINEVIKVEGFNNIGNNQMSFTVERSHNVNGDYLNVQLSGLEDYQDVDGLFGRIGNNLFQFYDNIQTGKDSNAIRGTVSINGRFAVASKKVRYRTSCWLLNVNDVLHPYPISKYVLSN